MSGAVRRVLVTGASAGIGQACAGELQAAGWSVTGASRRGTKLYKTQCMILVLMGLEV